MEFETVRRLMANDRFANESGIRLLEVREGFAKASMEVLPHHHNGVGTVAGRRSFHPCGTLYLPQRLIRTGQWRLQST